METYTITVGSETYTARKLTGFELLDVIGDYQATKKLGSMFKTLILESILDDSGKKRRFKESDIASWDAKRVTTVGKQIMDQHKVDADEDFLDSGQNSQTTLDGTSRFT